MVSGVYIGTSSESPYGIISTGDYVNPLIFSFKVKDTQKTVDQIKDLFLIINDTEVERIKIEVTGRVTTVRYKLSKDAKVWMNELIWDDNIKSFGRVTVIPFYIKFSFDDFLIYYNSATITQLTNFKLRLIYI